MEKLIFLAIELRIKQRATHMTHKKHHRQIRKDQLKDNSEQGDTHQIPKKRSLGALRQNEKTKPRSPEATGQFHFQRHTLKEIYRQLANSGDDEVICNIAAWQNSDQDGPFLTVEISPWFVSRERQAPRNRS